MLAAGSGRRYGTPKALVDTGAGPWVRGALEALRLCDERIVVLGARADEVARLVPTGVRLVHNPGFADGMASSLRAGLRAVLDTSDVGAALVHLVDLPDVGADVVGRVLQEATAGPAVLARAAYRGVPGHPVLLGRNHLAAIIASTHDEDQGARGYLAGHAVELIECGDLADGLDVDQPLPG